MGFDLAAVLTPFAHPRSTSRASTGGAAEDDLMTIEVQVSDWMRVCAVLGKLDGDYLRCLPDHARPSAAFIKEIEQLTESVQTAHLTQQLDPTA